MSYIFITCIAISSLSFLVYSLAYFLTPYMKDDFKRFNLEKYGLLTIILEILGAFGLLFGLLYKPVLLLSSGGLSLLMFFGLLVRIKSKDSFWVSLPAFFFMCLNGYIFYLGFNYL